MRTLRIYGIVNRKPEPTPFDSSDWPDEFSPEQVAAVLERLTDLTPPAHGPLPSGSVVSAILSK